AFLPLLEKAATHVSGDALSADRAAILNIGSDCSSQALNLRGSGPSNSLLAYKMSKVAMLSMARTMAADLKVKNLPVLITTIHPGWVQTDMGGSNAEISVDESVTKIVAGIGRLEAAHNGGIFNRDLEAMPF
uniref:Short-chain dehydrogenase n=1 Tax=Caenorhabditis japonica TaxID=281687 RepID=A0A8R1EKG2_CAEJA